MTEKRCSRCKQLKPPDAFTKDRKAKDGLCIYCRLCARAIGRAWRQSNPQRYRESTRRTNLRRRDKKREWAKQNARKPCERCGGPMGEGAKYQPTWTFCPACKVDVARERTARWLDLRRSGLDNWEIAEREGVSTKVIANTLQRSRVARFPDLEYVRAPYMTDRQKKSRFAESTKQ